MKAAFVWTALLLVGAAHCAPQQSKISTPEWWPEHWPEIYIPDIDWSEINWPEHWPQLPDIDLSEINWPEVIIPDIDWPNLTLPEIIEWLPNLPGLIQEIISQLEVPDWFPNLDDIEKPEWWPTEWPELPEWPGWENIPWPEIEIPDVEINRAVPGVRSFIQEFPGIVQIEVGSGPIWAQGCAGVIVTNFHIVSSGRCFSGIRYDNRFRRVRAGATSRYEGGIVNQISNALVHPSFTTSAENFFEGDIAIVRLASALVFGDTIQMSQIISSGYPISGDLPVVLASWGATAEGNKISTRYLYQIDLATVDVSTCNSRWSELLIPTNSITVTNNMLCVARPETGGRDADIRDVGAPVYFQNILVGVVSYGNYLGNQKYPVVATNVASYTDWIVQNAV